MNVSRTFRKFGLMLLVPCGLAVVGLTLPAGAVAQRPTGAGGEKKKNVGDAPQGKRADSGKKDAKATNQDEDEKSKPRAVDLETTDGVLIAATYFPAKQPNKNAPIIMLLHGFGEKQRMFDEFAFNLQDHGYAVLSFDFRGHGKSTSRVIGPRADVKGPTAAGKMDFHELGKPQMPWGTLQLDIDAARSFLVQRNNAGELNLSKLGLVGSEMGATMAIMWAYKDWSYPSQVGFSGKQGQDVQALVLISPTYNFKGVTLTRELPELQKMVPMQFVVGKKDPKAYGEAEKMFKAMKGRPTEANSQLTELKTNLQGSKLLNPELELDADKAILKFLDSTVKQKGTKWEARESPEGNAPVGQ